MLMVRATTKPTWAPFSTSSLMMWSTRSSNWATRVTTMQPMTGLAMSSSM